MTDLIILEQQIVEIKYLIINKQFSLNKKLFFKIIHWIDEKNEDHFSSHKLLHIKE